MSAQHKKHPFDFKTQYGLGFNPQDDEIVVDFFCGGGGAGTGLEMGLGRAVNVAKNHSPQAISMHTVNHPGAQHFTTDVFDGDPDRRACTSGRESGKTAPSGPPSITETQQERTYRWART
ncbi:hypothetical protein J2Y83_003222 [Pseudomonas marginalis]|nr:hypothetical protein [Pseudomonas marginalis]MCP1524753.1 hypothetical protein [Pseudomonas marginalis]